MRIYLDVSCLNRPFDDQTQSRVHLESEAVLLILDEIDGGRWEQISSRMANIEIQAIPDEKRRRRVAYLLPETTMNLTSEVFGRSRELVSLGLKAADAVHTAAAERLQADVLLTCDDRWLRKGKQLADRLFVRIANPVDWLKEQYEAPHAG
jgi:predicted nucleic acid-binding protein